VKRRTWKKRARRRYLDGTRYLRASNDRHDRWYLLAFVRESVAVLACVGGGVDQKVIEVAALARRLAPAIMIQRAMVQGGEDA
jgi:hypothetical protein